jgi:lysine/ornithine N-monooxygenase
MPRKPSGNQSFLNYLKTNIDKLYQDYNFDLQALKDIRDQSIAHSDKKVKI